MCHEQPILVREDWTAITATELLSNEVERKNKTAGQKSSWRKGWEEGDQ